MPAERLSEKNFTAEVSDIREHSRREGRPIWQISLTHTAFVPGSTGVLRATARSGASIEIQVTAVEEDEAGELWHTTEKPLLAGTSITARAD